MIGCGRWGSRILRDLLGLGCEVSVVDVSADRRRHAAGAGARFTAERIDALPEIDGAIVATPTTLHEQAIEELLGRDVPVFVEKPLTSDLRSAERLARQAGERLFVMDKWRYHPGVEALRDIARSGELGPVLGLVTERLGLSEAHADVDAVWILVPHELSIALEVLGGVPVPRSAVGAASAGRLVHLSALLGESPWHTLTVSALAAESRRAIRLVCSEGFAVLDDPYADPVLVLRPGADTREGAPAVERRPISTELPLLRELRAFLDHLRGGPPPRSSAREGATVVGAIARLRDLALDLSHAPDRLPLRGGSRA